MNESRRGQTRLIRQTVNVCGLPGSDTISAVSLLEMGVRFANAAVPYLMIAFRISSRVNDVVAQRTFHIDKQEFVMTDSTRIAVVTGACREGQFRLSRLGADPHGR